MVGKEFLAARFLPPRFLQSGASLSRTASHKQTPWYRFIRQLTSLLIAAVALTGLDASFRLLLDVPGKRATLVVRLLKLALVITPNVTFVRTRID